MQSHARATCKSRRRRKRTTHSSSHLPPVVAAPLPPRAAARSRAAAAADVDCGDAGAGEKADDADIDAETVPPAERAVLTADAGDELGADGDLAP